MEPAEIATFEKVNGIKRAVASLKVKDKRSLFQIMRLTDDLNADTFFPQFGITAGQFAVFYVLVDNNRKK